MKIVFFGLPLGALLLLEDGHELLQAVLTPLPHPGRRRLARRLGADRIADAAELGDQLAARVDERALRDAELLVSWFWTRRLPQRWLTLPRLGAIGAHPSLLPRHRGPDPFFWAIDSGDPETGVSVHRLEPEYDTGPVIDQVRIPVGDSDAGQLARRLDRPSLELLRRTVARFERGPIAELAQDEACASLAPEPSGELLEVDWSWATARVLRRIRALSPVPGLALDVVGVKLFVTRASATDAVPPALRPGEAIISDELVAIRTGDAGIVIERCVIEAGGAAGKRAPNECQDIELDRRNLARMVLRRREV